MRSRRALALALLVATACGGDGGSGPGRGDYFTQLARVSETAHIQERGLNSDLKVRLQQVTTGADRLDALTVFADQSARLYKDVIDALEGLEAPDAAASAQDAYLAAWQSQLDLVIAVRDAGFPGPNPFLEALDAPAFDDARAETRARCDALQSAIRATGSEADLACGPGATP